MAVKRKICRKIGRFTCWCLFSVFSVYLGSTIAGVRGYFGLFDISRCLKNTFLKQLCVAPALPTCAVRIKAQIVQPNLR